MDDKLQLHIKGVRQSTAGSDKPHEGRYGGEKPQEEQHSDAESDRPFTTATPKKTMRKLHPQIFPNPRPVIQSLDLSQLDEIDSQRGDAAGEAIVRQRPTMDRIRKLESELRETKAVDL